MSEVPRIPDVSGESAFSRARSRILLAVLAVPLLGACSLKTGDAVRVDACTHIKNEALRVDCLNHIPKDGAK